MTHVLLLCPDEKDSTSYFRMWGPFGEVARTTDAPILLTHDVKINWQTVSDKHLVVVQRPWEASHLEIFDTAKRNGVPTWVDWDDLLWAIPEGNPSKRVYHDGDAIYQTCLRCVERADIVTVSTDFFRRAFPPVFYHKIQVVRNRLPTRWRRQTAPQKATAPVKIAWRGSRTHDADWLDYLDVLVAFGDQHPIEWHLIGQISPYVTERLSSTAPVFLYEEISLERYFEWFIGEGPHADVLFVPLRDCPFNRAKSHIALLEATYAGMLCVAPRWEEWITGIPHADRLLYASPDEVGQCLARACQCAQQGALHLVQQLQTYWTEQAEQAEALFRDLVFAHVR